MTKILTYHVVPGKLDSAALMAQAKMHGGMHTLQTVSGGALTVVTSGAGLAIKDEKGGMATITTADVYQSNGVIHVISAVAMPK